MADKEMVLSFHRQRQESRWGSLWGLGASGLVLVVAFVSGDAGQDGRTDVIIALFVSMFAMFLVMLIVSFRAGTVILRDNILVHKSALMTKVFAKASLSSVGFGVMPLFNRPGDVWRVLLVSRRPDRLRVYVDDLTGERSWLKDCQVRPLLTDRFSPSREEDMREMERNVELIRAWLMS